MSLGLHLIFSICNFLALLSLLVWLLRRPLCDAFWKKRATVEEKLKVIEHRRHAAKERYRRIQHRLTGLRAEIDTLREMIATAAERECHEIIANAEQMAERVQKDGERQMAQEIAHAEEELRHVVLKGAFGLVERELEHGIPAERQHAILEASVAHFESLGHFGTSLSPAETSGRPG